MNIKKCLKILLCGLLFITAGICIGDKSDKVGFTDPSKPIVVKQTDPGFSIILQSNPTTGYSWFLKSYDTDLISPISRKFYPSTNKKLVGAPGYEKWNFRVKSSGFAVPQVTNIVLIYARPWEDQGAQATNFKVVITNDN